MPLQESQKVVMFVNWSKEKFVGLWNSVAYPFNPGEKKYMPEWKARHFAKHLANRELIRDGFENDTSPKVKPDGTVDNDRFNEYRDKAIVDSGFSGDTEQVEDEVINKNIEMANKRIADLEGNDEGEELPVDEVEEDAKSKPKKRGRPAKAKDEDEFEGLN